MPASRTLFGGWLVPGSLVRVKFDYVSESGSKISRSSPAIIVAGNGNKKQTLYVVCRDYSPINQRGEPVGAYAVSHQSSSSKRFGARNNQGEYVRLAGGYGAKIEQEMDPDTVKRLKQMKAEWDLAHPAMM